MASVETRYEHIVLNEQGVPHIAGSTMKVIDLVLNHQAYGWSPEELHFQHPHISLGQIYSALAYYSDHKTKLDQEIEQNEERIEELRRNMPESPFVTRMKKQS